MNWILDEVRKKTTSSFRMFWYVDLFLEFDKFDNTVAVFDLFNSIHEQIRFTKKHERQNQIAFLDVNIVKSTAGIETPIYRKPTFIGAYISWQSYVPPKYKQNLIFSLLDRAHKICNNCVRKDKEFRKISAILQKRVFLWISLIGA